MGSGGYGATTPSFDLTQAAKAYANDYTAGYAQYAAACGDYSGAYGDYSGGYGDYGTADSVGYGGGYGDYSGGYGDYSGVGYGATDGSGWGAGRGQQRRVSTAPATRGATVASAAHLNCWT